MSNLLRNFKIFLLYSKFALKSTFLNPIGSFFFLFGKIMRFVMFFLFVYFLVTKTGILKGYSVNQAIIFYLTFNLVDTLVQTLFREVYRFRELVVTGELDGVLVRPYHPFLKVLIGGVDFLDLLITIPYLLLTLFFISKESGLSTFRLGSYFILMSNALLIATAFHIAVLALGILTTEVDHTIMIYRDLTSFGRFPIEIYKEPVRGILTFVIPIGVMMSFPPQALFGILTPVMTIYSFILGLVLFLVSLKFWDFAIKKYQSWGG